LFLEWASKLFSKPDSLERVEIFCHTLRWKKEGAIKASATDEERVHTVHPTIQRSKRSRCFLSYVRMSDKRPLFYYAQTGLFKHNEIILK